MCAYRFFPGIDETKLFPIDAMHAESDGVLGEECYQCFHVLIKRRQYFTLEEANRRIRQAPARLWTDDGIRVRELPTMVLEALRCGPMKKKILWTAAETQKFALVSCQIFDEIIPAHEPVWQCWKLHVSYLKIMLQHSFTAQDILLMDKLIFEHQTLFNKVHSAHTCCRCHTTRGRDPCD